MTANEFILLFSAIPIGLVSGLIFGMPPSLVILLALPLLWSIDPNFILAFYVIIMITSQYTNSVMAIYTGIPGDITAIPIVKERKSLFQNFSIRENLQRTAVASTIGVIFGWTFLLLFFEIISQYSNNLMRSTIILAVLVSILLISIFWKGNHKLINFFLVIVGSVTGMVGYHYIINLNVLTFNNLSLIGGLPLIAGFSGLYAIPNILHLTKFYKDSKINENFNEDSKQKPFFFVDFRTGLDSLWGSFIGIMGLIPLIGCTMSSNLSYAVSKKITPISLRRAVFSESANSSAFVIVMAPLLFFGVAIIPSEFILLETLRGSGWRADNVNRETFFILLFVSLLTVVISYYFSTRIAQYTVIFLIKYIKYISIFLLFAISSNVYFIGGLTNEYGLYMTTFAFSSMAGIILNKLKIDTLPLIFSWAIAEMLINTSITVISLYS